LYDRGSMTTASRHAALTARKLTKHIYIGTTPEGANLGVIVHEDGAVAIDLPYGAHEAVQWRAEIAKLTQKPLRAVMFTSPDRFSGEALNALSTPRAKVPGYIQDQGFQALYAQLEASYPHAPELGIPFHVREQACLPELTFAEHASFVLGSRDNAQQIEITHVGGCAAGACFVTVRGNGEDSGVVFVGEHVAVDEPPVFGGGDLEKWARALTALGKARHVRTIVPGRGTLGGGEIVEGTTEFVKALRAATGRVFRKEHPSREDLAAMAPDLASAFDTRRKTRADQQMVEEQYAVRIRTGLEALFEANSRSTQAIIV
jgi:hypothetical protein